MYEKRWYSPDAYETFCLAALGFSLLRAANRAQSVDCGNPADRASGEASLQHFTVGTHGEISRVDDAATLFPIGADTIGIVGDFQTVPDRKCRAGALDHFFGFVEGIDR